VGVAGKMFRARAASWSCVDGPARVCRRRCDAVETKPRGRHSVKTLTCPEHVWSCQKHTHIHMNAHTSRREHTIQRAIGPGGGASAPSMAWHGGHWDSARVPWKTGRFAQDSGRTGPAIEHADWADPPTVRLTRATLDRDRPGSHLYGSTIDIQPLPEASSAGPPMGMRRLN
jgi:hypothetical protein